jgi:hypothetical protein
MRVVVVELEAKQLGTRMTAKISAEKKKSMFKRNNEAATGWYSLHQAVVIRSERTNRGALSKRISQYYDSKKRMVATSASHLEHITSNAMLYMSLSLKVIVRLSHFVYWLCLRPEISGRIIVLISTDLGLNTPHLRWHG